MRGSYVTEWVKAFGATPHKFNSIPGAQEAQGKLTTLNCPLTSTQRLCGTHMNIHTCLYIYTPPHKINKV